MGVSVYDLLGGAYRKQIEFYANYWFTEGSGTPADYKRQIQKVVEADFTACKFDPFAHTSYLYGTDLRENLSLSAEQNGPWRGSLRSPKGLAPIFLSPWKLMPC